MFAILISEDNLPKIQAHQADLTMAAHFHAPIYLAHHGNWYYVRGYVDRRGAFADWACFPEIMLRDSYEYDPIKIQNDWDLIVRK